MVRPIFESYTPSTASLTNYASNVTGLSWTITTNTTADGLAHQVTIRNDSATDHSGKTVTLTGRDSDAADQTNTFALPGPNATVTSTLYFSYLATAVPSATIGADTMDIGSANTFASRTIASDRRGSEAFVETYPTGTINTTVEYTGSNIQGGCIVPPASRPYKWISDAGTDVVNTAIPGSTTFKSIPMAWRLIANSYSAGASVDLTISQMNPQS